MMIIMILIIIGLGHRGLGSLPLGTLEGTDGTFRQRGCTETRGAKRFVVLKTMWFSIFECATGSAPGSSAPAPRAKIPKMI